MSTNLITLKIEQDILDEVKIIAENKFPLRKITFYSEAVREALYEFIKRNKKYYKNEIANKPTESVSEGS